MVEMQTVPDKLGCKNETEAVALTSSCFVLSPNFPAIDLCHAKGSPLPVHSQSFSALVPALESSFCRVFHCGQQAADD